MNKELITDIISIIDTVAKRGAFHAVEFSGVGALRDQLVAMLEAAASESDKAE